MYDCIFDLAYYNVVKVFGICVVNKLGKLFWSIVDDVVVIGTENYCKVGGLAMQN